MIEVKADFSQLLEKMTTLQMKQIPFAMSLAINRTAKKIKEAQEREIKDVFDRPTPYIQNSVFLKPSTKNDLTAIVGIKDQSVKAVPPSKILSAEIVGGERRLKRYEKALRAVGALPPGYVATPGKGATFDAYGNISKGQIEKILAYFKAFPEAGYKANSTAESMARLRRGTRNRVGISYFVGRPANGRLPLGIYQRSHASARFSGPVMPLRPILIFIPTALYEATLDFRFVAENIIKKEFDSEFNKALVEAMRTAK
ncbi:hypothetical protein [Nitrosomonas sp. Nm34]|uniref:hypothetical protein n=1 Tax=Nitrosomonas sp. Nm34 TaxID=1881055 RepID=UPI0008E58F29|nr:hypothetical protein [Nitrosomonas sp. Nm34]SFI75308.1 hypothetical protein SAMN05428978_103244 [Nitrosomonas sp. Nm34]